MNTRDWLQLGLLIIGVVTIYLTFRNMHSSEPPPQKKDIPVIKLPESERLPFPPDEK